MNEHRDVSQLLALAVPLHAWDGEATPAARLAQLEADVRAMIADLAASRSATAAAIEAHQEEVRRLLVGLLGVVDGFDRVFGRIDDTELAAGESHPAWVANFRTVARMLRSILTEHGVEEIERGVGRYDPSAHTVAETVAGDAAEEGTIVGHLRPGYHWRGVVLRKAEVAVVRAGEGRG